MKTEHNADTQKLNQRITELEDKIENTNEEMSQVKIKNSAITSKNATLKSFYRTLFEENNDLKRRILKHEKDTKTVETQTIEQIELAPKRDQLDNQDLSQKQNKKRRVVSTTRLRYNESHTQTSVVDQRDRIKIPSVIITAESSIASHYSDSDHSVDEEMPTDSYCVRSVKMCNSSRST